MIKKGIYRLMLIGFILAKLSQASDEIRQFTYEELKDHIAKNNQNLIFFHGTECVYCNQVIEMWKQLKKSNEGEYPNLQFGLIDVSLHPEVKEEEDIEQVPQIRLYLKEGFFSFFDEEFLAANLQSFLDYHLRTLAEPTHVDTDRSFVRYNNKANSIMLAFPEMTKAEKEFALGLQMVIPDIPVYYTLFDSKYGLITFPSDSSKSKYKMKFKRNFDEGDKFLGTTQRFLPRHILKIVWPLRKSKIEVLGERHLKQIFNSRKSAIVFFDDDYNSEAADHFTKAVLNKGWDGLALKSKLEEKNSDKLRNFFGVTSADFPAIRVIRHENGEFIKYKLIDTPNTENIEEFFDRLAEKKIKGYKKNQKQPDNKDRKVLLLNRENFYAQVQDKRTHFVFAFVGKNSTLTEELLEQTQFLVKNPDRFTFALIDVNQNEIDNLDKKQIPQIQILTMVQRKRSIKYDGTNNPAEFAGYLNEAIDFSEEL